MPWARDPKRDLRELQQAWVEDRHLMFAMIEKTTATVLGVAGLNREGRDVVELNYWIRTDHAGRGLTTEAGRALIEWARDELGMARVTLWAGRENHASRRVADKLGFMHVGPLDWRPEGGLGDFAAESYELSLSSSDASSPARSSCP